MRSAAIETIDDLTPESLASFDEIIDVRSPSEHAQDHVPGAINLPVLNDAERAEIGTIYSQQSAFLARRAGAAIVARNIAAHLETALSGKPASYLPLIYCWRGGMRSSAMATILAAIGWRPSLVRGGYKTWRREVVAALGAEAGDLPLVLIDGQTGAAKTEILQRLAARDAQVLDLEGLARHRGSVFGGFADIEQPSQKRFETLIWDELRRFDLTCPIFVEAESRGIGRCQAPERLWRAMLAAPRIEIVAPAAARAAFLCESYSDLADDRERMLAGIERLAKHHARETSEEWRELAQGGDIRALAERLIVEHYDPLYARARAKRRDDAAKTVQIETLDAASLDDAVARILKLETRALTCGAA